MIAVVALQVTHQQTHPNHLSPVNDIWLLFLFLYLCRPPWPCNQEELLVHPKVPTGLAMR